MNKKLKIKISGNNIKSLFYGLSLARINDFYIDFELSKNSLQSDEKIYSISENTKVYLEKLYLWDKLKPKLNSIYSYSYFSTYFKKEILFCFKNNYKQGNKNGNSLWTLKHSDLVEVLFDEIEKENNINFIESNEINFFSKNNFYYNFCLDEINLNSKNSNGFRILKNFFSSSSIIFRVLLRGNVEKRAYENIIFGESLLMIPLENNIYQIIWKANTNKSNYRFNLNENLLLDNLSTMLPNNFKLDQIVGDIKIFTSSSYWSNSIKFYKKGFSFVDFENFTQHIFLNELDPFFYDLNTVLKILSSKKKFKVNIFRNLKYRFFIKRIIRIFSKIFINAISLRILMKLNIFRKLFIRTYLLFVDKNLIINNFFKDIILKLCLISIFK